MQSSLHEIDMMHCVLPLHTAHDNAAFYKPIANRFNAFFARQYLCSTFIYRHKFSQHSDIGLAQLVQRLHASYIVVGDVLLSEEERKLSSMQSFSAMSVCI